MQNYPFPPTPSSNLMGSKQTDGYTWVCIPALSHSVTLSAVTFSWMNTFLDGNFSECQQFQFFFLRDLFGFCLTVVSMYFLSVYSVIRLVPPAYLGHSHPAAISPPHVFDSLWLRYGHANIIISSLTYSFNKLSSHCVFAGVGTILKGNF